MEEKNLNQQNQSEGTYSNIIFGTSSDDIERGLHNNQFIDETTPSETGDKDQIVNEEEQNEIVNPSVETFNEEPAPQTIGSITTGEQQKSPGQSEENVIDLDPDKEDIDKTGKISGAED